MTKEEAIEWLKSLNYCDGEETQEVAQAIEMGIKSLEQQSSDCKIFGHKENCIGGADCENCDYKIQAEQPTSDDCVSRAEAKEHAWNLCLETSYDNEKVVEMLDELPPVTPTRKVGKWIYTPTKRLVDETDEGAIYDTQLKCNCSVCGADFGYRKVDDNYCKYCGADMRGSENG